jgi:hypothetical protein
VNEFGIASAAIPYPVTGAPSTRRPIQISSAIRRAVIGRLILATASLLLGRIGSLLHHHVAVTKVDSALCKRQ